jgi:hypothetical protein
MNSTPMALAPNGTHQAMAPDTNWDSAPDASACFRRIRFVRNGHSTAQDADHQLEQAFGRRDTGSAGDARHRSGGASQWESLSGLSDRLVMSCERFLSLPCAVGCLA